MKKATFKQTTVLLLLSLFFAFPFEGWTQMTAIETQCKMAERHISERGGDLNEEEAAGLCIFLKDLNQRAMDACPAPTNLRASVDQSTRTVDLRWDAVADALYYRVSYYDVNNGAVNTFDTDVNMATIPNLPPAEYYMAVQSICGEGNQSEPEGTYLVIIGDIAILRYEPSDECYCKEYKNLHGGAVLGTQTMQGWAVNLDCGIEKYDLNINLVERNPGGGSGDRFDLRMQVNRNTGTNPNDIFVDICTDDGIQAAFQPSEIRFSLPGSSNTDFKMQFSYSGGFIIYPNNVEFDYEWSIGHCCSIKEGNNKEDKDGSSRSGGLTLDEKQKGGVIAAPNPFNQNTRIDYTMLEDGELSLILFNSLGQPIRHLQQGLQQAGEHQVFVDGSDLSPGLYFIHLKTKRQDEIVRMIKL